MFIFKGQNSEGKLRVLKVTRSLLPPSNVRTMELDGKAGALFLKRTHGMKKIDVDVVLVGTSQEDYREKARDIADWLDSEKPESLVFSDEPHLTDYAIIDGETNLDEELKYGFGTISFLCPDPYSIGDDKTQNLTSGSNTVSYQGTAVSYPVVTVNFTASASQFSISNGEEEVVVELPFVAGDVLVIDMDTGKVTKNATLNMQAVTLQSDFFPLKKGTNTLEVSAAAKIDYKERFK